MQAPDKLHVLGLLRLTDAYSFFTETGVELNCASCGSDDTDVCVITGSQTKNPRLLWTSLPAGLPDRPLGTLPFFMTRCEECGHTRFYSADAIYRWLEQDGKIQELINGEQ